jgi:hypothetical protein
MNPESTTNAGQLDIVATDKRYYTAPATPELVELSPAQFISIEGVGAPGGEAHLGAIRILYQACEWLARDARDRGRGFLLPPMEGLWWVDGDRSAFDVPRDEWHWRLLLRLPAEQTEETVRKVAAQLGDRAAERVRFTELNEGLCVQALHAGRTQQRRRPSGRWTP